MAKKAKRKGESGYATAYITRSQALKRLQLSLKDFRRLCIIKGIYPHEPRSKKNVPGSQNNKTFYYLKDIQFLSHEPIIQKFRDFRAFLKKLKRAVGRDDLETADRLKRNKPVYKLDHVVKERYPTFIDSLRDLDDPLSMCALFATFPKFRNFQVDIIDLCRRLIVEFMHYVIESKSLRKVFISIKGYYYQAEIQGQSITWVVPHNFSFKRPPDVDFKVMSTFTEFYTTMIGFINYKLYNSINLHYPPVLHVFKHDQDEETEDKEEKKQESIAALNLRLRAAIADNFDEDIEPDDLPMIDDVDKLEEMKKEQESINRLQSLFKGLKFFINREVPRESLTFVIRSMCGEVSWDKTLFVGASFDETDETVTHQIVDRPNINQKYLTRYYIQPQWVYDCVNARMLLPVEDYFVGVVLPPHLSPFVDEKDGDYIPPEKQKLLTRQSGDLSDESEKEEATDEDEMSEKESDDENSDDVAEDTEMISKSLKMSVSTGKVQNANVDKLTQKTAAEELRLAVMMIPKKKKRLYDRIIYGQKRKNREAEKLKTKREEYEVNKKKLKSA